MCTGSHKKRFCLNSVHEKHTPMKSYKHMHNPQSFFCGTLKNYDTCASYLHCTFKGGHQVTLQVHIYLVRKLWKKNDSNKYTITYIEFHWNLPLHVFVSLVLPTVGVLLPLYQNLNFEIQGIYYLPLGKTVTPQLLMPGEVFVVQQRLSWIINIK